MAFFAADDDQRDVSAVLQYRGQHDRGKICGGIGTWGGGSILPDYDHLHGLCGGHESGCFGGDFQIVWSRR